MIKALVHAIAQCEDCCWFNHDYNLAIAKGRYHAKTSHHKVNIELGYVTEYDFRIAAPHPSPGQGEREAL